MTIIYATRAPSATTKPSHIRHRPTDLHPYHEGRIEDAYQALRRAFTGVLDHLSDYELSELHGEGRCILEHYARRLLQRLDETGRQV
jgi:hypothetical protein